MKGLNNDALKKSLNIVKDLQKIEQEYGRETLITVLESVGGFFGLVSLVSPESVDREDLEKYKEENKIKAKNNEESLLEKPEPYENDSLESFGMYRDLMEKAKKEKKENLDISIYSQDPQILAKVAEDKQNDLLMEGNNISDFNKQTYYNEKPELYNEETGEMSEEKPPIKVLEPNNNPWASAGKPVPPGQIFKD